MVHALKEIWRVLVPDGILLDWRHLSTNCSVEIVSGEQVRLAGLLADSMKMENTDADKSLAQLESEGWFIFERQQSLDYAWYWDTFDEMKAHTEKPIELNWRPPVIITQAVLTEAQRLVAESGENTKVRIRFNMVISQYRRGG